MARLYQATFCTYFLLIGPNFLLSAQVSNTLELCKIKVLTAVSISYSSGM